MTHVTILGSRGMSAHWQLCQHPYRLAMRKMFSLKLKCYAFLASCSFPCGGP